MSIAPQLLIDADLFLYKATSAAEYEADWGDGVIVASTNIDLAKDCFNAMLKSCADTLGTKDFVFVLSGRDNFRKHLAGTYKADRVSRKPLGYWTLVDWLKEDFADQTVWQECLEADDYMGILATAPNAPPRIICSDDKDMLTIPGKLYRLGNLTEQSADDAERFWLYQTLVGDQTDGYKGCSGIGAVSAEKILSKPGDRWENVLAAFRKAGHDDDHALLQARIARILHYDDWDSKAKQPILWSPDKG